MTGAGKRQLLCLHTFTFTMTGAGKKQKLLCVHNFTFTMTGAIITTNKTNLFQVWILRLAPPNRRINQWQLWFCQCHWRLSCHVMSCHVNFKFHVKKYRNKLVTSFNWKKWKTLRITLALLQWPELKQTGNYYAITLSLSRWPEQ